MQPIKKRMKTGGRRPGSVNKATATIKEMAQQYTVDAVRILAEIMVNSIDDKARIAAANAILDRGHGKPAQSLDELNEFTLRLAALEEKK